MSREVESNDLGRVWVALIAALALVAVASGVAVLADAAYSNFVDGHPLWGFECVVLALVPLIVAVASYRGFRRLGLSGGALAWRVSVIVFAVEVVVLGVVAVLSAPL